MRYWDTSALLPILIDEPGTKLSRAWLEEDGEICTWGMTHVEMASAIERRAREGRLTAGQRTRALREAELLVSHAHEVTDALAVRKRATLILARHSLRAGDAAQLASALLIADPEPGSLSFVCLDRRLGDAASREGMPVLGWPE
ncbi:MAG: type II toxin-antitoxin system VapC family toxin [Deltaproteobacteria bacterium]|nr:type II toxin-antitoxin system VapC family toxin [Deltaproteobacteria bacterium]